MQSMLMLVSGGTPLGKVWKEGTQRLNVEAFQDLIIAVIISYLNWKLISNKHDLDKLTIAISIHNCTASDS